MVVKAKNINHLTHKPAAYEGGHACSLFSDFVSTGAFAPRFHSLPQDSPGVGCMHNGFGNHNTFVLINK